MAAWDSTLGDLLAMVMQSSQVAHGAQGTYTATNIQRGRHQGVGMGHLGRDTGAQLLGVTQCADEAWGRILA